MATKTRMSKLKVIPRTRRKEMKEKTAHSSLLMMLSSQLLGTGRFNKGLPSFIMRGLDSEQIWQQLELRNEHSLSLAACTREVVQISSRTQSKKLEDKKQKLKKSEPPSVTLKSDNGDGKEISESDDEDGMLNSIKKRLAEESASDEDDELDSFSENGEKDELDFDFELEKEASKGISDDEEKELSINHGSKKVPQKSVIKKASIVDDKFFKLADAEQFLDSEDLKEEKRKQKKKRGNEDTDDSDEEDDDEIEMFDDLDSDSNDAQGAKYMDFFDPPDNETPAKEGKYKGESQKKLKVKNSLSGADEAQASDDDSESGMEDESEMEDAEDVDDDMEEHSDIDDNSDEKTEENEKNENKENKKTVSFTNDLLQSDDEIDMPADTKSSKTKSTFELKQEQLQAKAREMEELSLKEASWELTGEVSSSKRPENSLLDTVLDFQHTTKAAPVITDETTKTLEDYIKQRIKDKTFDDVERKEKPKEDVFEFKKRIVLDQEKSKLSLGELYEQEFLKQQQTQSDEVKADPECEKIEKDLNKLFKQLDALSNFRYTPMRPGTEVKIIVNTPAIAMEEVAPVATADSELLAPEEVYERKKGDLKADDERSSTDKKRARRQKKKEKQERKKAKESREKVVQKLKPGLGNKYSKVKALKQLEHISKSDKNITMIKGDQKKLSSSTFFTQLQEEVQTNAKVKKSTKEKKKKIVDASKLML